MVDCRVVSEDEYQLMITLLERASKLIGNPCTGISSSCDIICDQWRDDYEDFIS